MRESERIAKHVDELQVENERLRAALARRRDACGCDEGGEYDPCSFCAEDGELLEGDHA